MSTRGAAEGGRLPAPALVPFVRDLAEELPSADLRKIEELLTDDQSFEVDAALSHYREYWEYIWEAYKLCTSQEQSACKLLIKDLISAREERSKRIEQYRRDLQRLRRESSRNDEVS